MRRAPTRRQRARWQRERRQRRILLIALAVVIAVAVITPAYGYYREFIAKSQETIARVDGATLSVGDYAKLLRYRVLPLQIQAQQLQAFGSDPSIGQQRQLLAQQIGAMPTQAVFDWAEGQVIRGEAMKMGITVSPADIDKELRKRVTGQDPDAAANATATAAVTTPSPTATPAPPTATSTAAPTVEASPAAAVGTPSAATPGATTPVTGTPGVEGSATVAPATSPTPAPTPDFDTTYGRYRDVFGLSDSEIRAYVEADLYRQKVAEAIRNQAPKNAPQVDVSLIRASGDPTVTNALNRVRGGEDFAAVAKELSDHSSKSNGGNIGWTARGTLPVAVDAVAFSLPLGQISDPIKADDGTYIIIVNGRDQDRPLSDSAYAAAQSKAFTDWLDARKKEHQIEYAITSDKQLWASDQNKKYTARVTGG
jgi:hypothetical protein